MPWIVIVDSKERLVKMQDAKLQGLKLNLK